MRRSLSLAALLTLALAIGCKQILGIGDVEISTTSGGSSGGGNGGGSTGSSGGQTSCRLLHDAEDCGAKQRCTIVDPDGTGATGCLPLAPAPLPVYARCDDDGNCPQKTWCDHRTSVCMPFCTGAAECGSGSCVAARNKSDMTIPGASVCTAHCDPIAATPCEIGATCGYDAKAGDFDCFLSYDKTEGAMCSFVNDCGKGLVCAGNLCAKWCHPAGGAPDPGCPSGCAMFVNVTPKYNGETYGFCY